MCSKTLHHKDARSGRVNWVSSMSTQGHANTRSPAGPGCGPERRGGGPHHRVEAPAAPQALCSIRPDAGAGRRAGPRPGQLEPAGGAPHPHAAAERALHQRGHCAQPGGGAEGADQGPAVQRARGAAPRSVHNACCSLIPLHGNLSIVNGLRCHSHWPEWIYSETMAVREHAALQGHPTTC